MPTPKPITDEALKKAILRPEPDPGDIQKSKEAKLSPRAQGELCVNAMLKALLPALKNNKANEIEAGQAVADAIYKATAKYEKTVPAFRQRAMESLAKNIEALPALDNLTKSNVFAEGFKSAVHLRASPKQEANKSAQAEAIDTPTPTVTAPKHR